MKYFYLILILLTTHSFLASPTLAKTSTNNDLNHLLGVDELMDVLAPQEVSPGIFTPYAVRYFKKNDNAPTCVLIDKANLQNQIELVAPDEEGHQFENCSTPPNKPTIVKVKGDYYATYFYGVEETRKEFHTSNLTVHLTKNGVVQCGNLADISGLIDYGLRKKQSLVNASKQALMKLGCTVIKN